MNERTRTRVWRGIWIAFMALFLLTGGFGVTAISSRMKVKDCGPNNSTDRVFETLLGVADASRVVSQCVEDIPADEPIAVIFWDAKRSQLPALQLGTLLWPHPAPQLECENGKPPDMSRINGDRPPAAAFLLGIATPDGIAGVRRVGPLMSFQVLRAVKRP